VTKTRPERIHRIDEDTASFADRAKFEIHGGRSVALWMETVTIPASREKAML
jgi:hypothetical protein